MKDKAITFIKNLKSQISSERGDIGDSFMIIIVIFTAVGIMFIFPIMTIADRTDDMAQQTIQAALEKLVDQSCMSGEITPVAYSEAEATIASTGILGDLEGEIQVLDDNPSKKTVQVQRDKVGENWYYTIYDAQLQEDMFGKDGKQENAKKLKPGDRVTFKFKNTSLSWAEQIGSIVYTALGKNVSTISAEASGMVMSNSSK